jgi:H+-translocating NAD(P) transhydrogenase subunit alpha
MDPSTLTEKAVDIANQAKALANQAADLAAQAAQLGGTVTQHQPFIALFTVFVLACFVGYHVVWRVTPALHSPLMSVTNAISSVIIVGSLIAAGTGKFHFSEIMGFIAITLASVNIFGGFLVTHRMLSMFRKKQK